MGITNQQRKALHLWCEHIAYALTDAGYDDMRTIIKVPISPTKGYVKKEMIKPVMRALYPDLTSTEQLETEEINVLYDVINRAIAERFGIHIPFPSLETLAESKK